MNEWVPDHHHLQVRFELIYVNKANRTLDNEINRVIYDGVDLFLDSELQGFELERDTGEPFAADDIFSENVYSTVRYHFIEAPIRFTYAIRTGMLAPYVLVGPTFGIVTSFDHSFTLITEQGETYTQVDIASVVDQHFNKLNISADLGIGLRLPYGLLMEGYYTHGFTDSMKFYNNSTFQRGFVASLAIQF